jgi:hypothetical protein
MWAFKGADSLLCLLTLLAPQLAGIVYRQRDRIVKPQAVGSGVRPLALDPPHRPAFRFTAVIPDGEHESSDPGSMYPGAWLLLLTSGYVVPGSRVLRARAG